MIEPEIPQRIPRPLDAVERRVLGALLEKEQATPDAYPLSLNSLLAACNQKSNRDPAMELGEDEVRDALFRLQDDVLVWETEGARVAKWRQSVDRRWRLSRESKAIVTELLLRGAQTPGELRARCGRLHPFADVGEVLATLEEMASGEDPLVTELARGPGEKQSRWADLLSGEPEAAVEAAAASPPGPPAAVPRAPGLADRVAALEARLEELERAVAALRGG